MHCCEKEEGEGGKETAGEGRGRAGEQLWAGGGGPPRIRHNGERWEAGKSAAARSGATEGEMTTELRGTQRCGQQGDGAQRRRNGALSLPTTRNPGQQACPSGNPYPAIVAPPIARALLLVHTAAAAAAAADDTDTTTRTGPPCM